MAYHAPPLPPPEQDLPVLRRAHRRKIAHAPVYLLEIAHTVFVPLFPYRNHIVTLHIPHNTTGLVHPWWYEVLFRDDDVWSRRYIIIVHHD